MLKKNETEASKPTTSNLAANYRPLALKAVVAATMMLKRKPVTGKMA